MKAITLEELPVAIEDGDVQVRLRDEDGLSVGFVRLPPAPTCAPPPRAYRTTCAPAPTGAT